VPKARTKDTIKYRILEHDEVNPDAYTGERIVKKGMIEIDDGFHLKWFISEKEFNKRFERIE
jgi:hypothetical protein